MFSFPLPALLCAFCLLSQPCQAILRCLPDNSSLNPIIDDLFEDCGYEGPLPYIGDPPDSPFYQTTTFDFSSKDKARSSHYQLTFLLSERANGKGWHADKNDAKHVTIKGREWYGLLPLVEHCFGKLGGLETVKWEMREPITEPILRALEERNPRVKIYYEFTSLKQGMGSYMDSGPTWALANSSSLYSLTAHLDYGYHENYEGMDFLFAALSNASNLRELDIDIGNYGCESSIATPAWAWRRKKEDWDVLWEEYMQKDDDENPPPRPARLEDDGRTNLDAWLEVMDWSKLHTLELSYPSNITLQKLKGDTLPSLTNLSLSINDGYRNAQPNEVLSFINSTAQPLRSLSVQEQHMIVGDPLLEMLIASPNLTQELLHFAYRDSQESIFFLREKLISKFLLSAPKLQHLDIELRRNVNMSLESGLFKDLIDNPILKKLTLRFPSPDRHFEGMRYDDELELQYSEMRQKYIKEKDDGDEPDPLINYDTALALFKEMRAKKRRAELEELDFFVGIGRIGIIGGCWGSI
ncbi:uncharacterized protein PAC_19303 [Phialocephala subalpina]|uniref:Uncharacterized protein n=1 Tax=Phialocephala subalpina TaxID=576137 RepID=A0A1L7XWH7_9HELO|nr:uncharacterized protein PAC_19303 [Phialocephala subalpina]